jgi:hypothetical protein
MNPVVETSFIFAPLIRTHPRGRSGAPVAEIPEKPDRR